MIAGCVDVGKLMKLPGSSDAKAPTRFGKLRQKSTRLRPNGSLQENSQPTSIYTQIGEWQD